MGGPRRRMAALRSRTATPRTRMHTPPGQTGPPLDLTVTLTSALHTGSRMVLPTANHVARLQMTTLRVPRRSSPRTAGAGMASLAAVGADGAAPEASGVAGAMRTYRTI